MPPAAWELVASPELLARLEARNHSEMFRAMPLAEGGARPEVKLNVEPQAWSFGRIATEIRERELFDSFGHELRQLAPQALLRDLHRPVHDVFRPKFETRGQAVDFGGKDALADAKRAARTERMQPLPSMLQAVNENQDQRRKWLRTPWQPRYRDDEEHPSVTVVRWGE